MTASVVYRIVTDTTSYAGGFERQSIAFATGLVGDCGVGQGEAQTAQEELPEDVLAWWEDHGQQLPDEHAVLRPAAIWPTPGMFNHGAGGHFPCTDEGRAAGLIDYRKRTREYFQQQIDRLQYVTIGKNGWTEEGVERERAGHLKRIADADALDRVSEYPAYQSVAIVVDEPPPEHIMALFAERMRSFLAAQKSPVVVTNVGVDREETVVSRTRLSL